MPREGTVSRLQKTAAGFFVPAWFAPAGIFFDLRTLDDYKIITHISV
jgi:hypothetical protein